jgi:alpha-tubulin suppressor-like RCC1 family protein
MSGGLRTPALAGVIGAALLFGVAGTSYADSAGPYAWGQAHLGTSALGETKLPAPTLVAGIPNPVVQVVANNTDDYALDDEGNVWAWGAARNGELGDGLAGNAHSLFTTSPSEVQFPAGVVIASLPVTMPDATAMAVDTNGNVWGWGYDQHHQLCMQAQDLDLPQKVPVGPVSLTAGAGDHAVYDAGGTVESCGTNLDDDLGAGTTGRRALATPVAVKGLPGGAVSDLVASFHNSGAVVGGQYYDWGLGTGGQLGNGVDADSALAVQVPLEGPVEQVSLGGSLSTNGQSAAILEDGSVWAWGTGQYGQLCDGQAVGSGSPVPVTVPAGVSYTSVSSGGSSMYLIDSTGDAWACGQNQSGQLGTGRADTRAHPLPVSLGVQLSQITSEATNVVGLG